VTHRDLAGPREIDQFTVSLDDLTSQVSQLRVEMRDEFSAVRTEIVAGFAAIAVKTDKLEAKTDSLEAKTDGLAVQMRVLHEDVIARIALLQEAWPKPPKRTRKKS
jgi:outer membrane murein-binding lipoprotein Lpp